MSFVNKIKKIFYKLLKRENVYSFILITIIFFLDRVSKIKIINKLNENTIFVNDYINLDLVWNIGIGFGLLSTESDLMYNIITLIILIVIFTLSYILITSDGLEKFIYSVIIGGALGNFYDRLIYKAVPDFLDIHYNNIHWFIFNVADIFITMGIIALLFNNYFKNN
jgi:signal peptidase II